jgi:hypothetical protein
MKYYFIVTLDPAYPAKGGKGHLPVKGESIPPKMYINASSKRA